MPPQHSPDTRRCAAGLWISLGCSGNLCCSRHLSPLQVHSLHQVFCARGKMSAAGDHDGIDAIRPESGASETSRPVSRVLSGTVIHLGCVSPRTSCGLPGSSPRRQRRSRKPGWLPYSALHRVGFTLPPVLPPARCALTAPFHPYPVCFAGRFIFCGTFHELALSRRYLAPCLAEPGLSSIRPRPDSDRSADSHRQNTIYSSPATQ